MTKAKRRSLIAVAVLLTSGAGCVAKNELYGGEGFGIGAANLGQHEIEEVTVSAASDPGNVYHAQAGQRPFLGARPSFPSASTFPDNQQRIPEKVSVMWRDLPAQGQASYTGTQRGPFVVTIRSRIPSEVLRKARSRGFFIEIGLEINDGPIVMNWQLIESQSITRTGNDIATIRQGGDSFK
jgi:hypothetical protein